ncbi:MAG TPA: hypothetical protein VHJ78_01445 [Actinomycetota bacterium]|nr:hypothetical protein [Actinomycetota bacterium]
MKNVRRLCVIVAMSLLPLTALAAPAAAQTLSDTCERLNRLEYLDGQYVAAASEGPFFAGEHVSFTAGEPVYQVAGKLPKEVGLSVNLEPTDTARFPGGTVSYTFPEDGYYVLQWHVDDGLSGTNVTWNVTCGVAPALPTSPDDCKDGGWDAYGFKNQGECLKYLNGKK